MSKKNNKIAIHGCYDIENFGDLLLAAIVEQRIRRNLSEETVIPIRDRRFGIAWPLEFIGSQYCVWGGGGYLACPSNILRIFRFIRRYAVPSLLMRISKIPYSILCPGVDPVEWKISQQILKFICQGSRITIVRDEESKVVLTKIGVRSSQVKVAPDLVLSIRPEDLPEESRVSADRILSNTVPGMINVGVHLESIYVVNRDVFYKICQLIIKELSKSSIPARLVFLVDHNPEIIKAYSEVIKSLPIHSAKECLIVPKQDPWTTLAVLHKLEAVITSKLHVGIAAYSMGANPFALWTHPKTPRFYKMIDRIAHQASYSEWEGKIEAWIQHIFTTQSAERLDHEQRIRSELFTKANQAIDEIIMDINTLRRVNGSS